MAITVHIDVHPLLVVFIKDSKDLEPERVMHDRRVVRIVELLMDSSVQLFNLVKSFITVILATSVL